MAQPVVELYFDYASPFSYLADYRVESELAGLPIELRRIPVYLRGFEAFREAPPFSAAKLHYLAIDLARSARYHDVPLGVPAVIPVNGLYMLRGHVFLEGRPELDAFRRAAWRATWVDGANTSDPEVVMTLADEVGIDRRELAAGIGSAAVKNKLRENTERAVERQAFGVPTFYVGDEMFWGQDRLGHVRRYVEEMASGGAMLADLDEE
jgi:2-hydroxychromene-2-carboxylate isomerase